MHNFGDITGGNDPTKNYSQFEAKSYTTFTVDTNGTIPSFKANIVQRPIIFRGIPSPGASCGDGKPAFGCPFRTGGRGYVRFEDGTLVMTIIVSVFISSQDYDIDPV
jgi:hypothetical protein